MRTPIDEPIVYMWADGVHVKVRVGEDKRICLLVIIGSLKAGKRSFWPSLTATENRSILGKRCFAPSKTAA